MNEDLPPADQVESMFREIETADFLSTDKWLDI
jgi:hypothetical protein